MDWKWIASITAVGAAGALSGVFFWGYKIGRAQKPGDWKSFYQSDPISNYVNSHNTEESALSQLRSLSISHREGEMKGYNGQAQGPQEHKLRSRYGVAEACARRNRLACGPLQRLVMPDRAPKPHLAPAPQAAPPRNCHETTATAPTPRSDSSPA